MDPDTDTVLAVVFFELTDLPREIFDSDVVVLRAGRVVGEPLALSRTARTALGSGRAGDALSTWFPCAAPRLFRHAGGRVWLDVLQTKEPPNRHKSRHYVVYQRLDVTDLLGPGVGGGARPHRR